MNRISEFMVKHGYNQVEMAELLGTDKSQVNRWVKGRKIPEYILALIECLDASTKKENAHGS